MCACVVGVVVVVVVVVLEAIRTEAALVLEDLCTQPYIKSLHLTEQVQAFLNKHSRPAKRETDVMSAMGVIQSELRKTALTQINIAQVFVCFANSKCFILPVAAFRH